MTKAPSKEVLIDLLLSNNISIANLNTLRDEINEFDLSIIIQRIYDLNNEQVKKIAALAPVMEKVDNLKNSQRNHKFYKKVRGDFRNKLGNKVILVEGDSWFNYPILLSDVIDWIAMEDNLAVYSLAAGGDWLLNMLTARTYIEQLSTMRPDVFIISGGGNDLVGSNRLAAMVESKGDSKEYFNSKWAQILIENSKTPIDKSRFTNGIRYISKDFFALLMFFHLQYFFIFKGILMGGTNDPKKGKFPGIKIITQGYDYPIPDRSYQFGFNPLRWYKPFARLFLGHGSWLKRPLELRGISKAADQQDIIYAMIFLFNEMMIETGALFCEKMKCNCVYHIDSRDSVGKDGWTDELHPLPKHFKETAKSFVECINNTDLQRSPVFYVKSPKAKSL